MLLAISTEPRPNSSPFVSPEALAASAFSFPADFRTILREFRAD
jgi:hypothetical protein